MKTIYFISDVHLGGHDAEVERNKIEKLRSFFVEISGKADILYIVGDLYDFWFEYARAIPKINIKALAALNELIESGTEVRYFTGNHDIWHESFFEKELGVKIYHHPQIVSHNQLKLFIAHGDGLTKGEWKLRLIKRVFKNPVSIFLFRLLHPDVGIAITRLFSRGRREHKVNPFIEDYREFAQQKLGDGFDAVILGHTHMSVFEHHHQDKYYINLGEWIRNFNYLKLSGKKFEFAEWL